MKIQKMLIAVTGAAILSASCSGDDDFATGDQYTPKGAYDTGVLVLNQGAFTGGISTISYIGYYSGDVQNNIYAAANGDLPLGNTATDMAFVGNKAYIVLNGSDQIEIVDRYTMKNLGTITGFHSPRYIAVIGSKAYVTNWGEGSDPADDFVAVVDLSSNAISGNIPVNEGPEKIIPFGNRLYVAHYGGFGFGNTISVIDTGTNSVATTINVGDLPTSLQIDNGVLWVACEGKPVYSGSETGGKIQKIDLSTNTVINTYPYSQLNYHITHMGVVNSVAYFTMGSDVYRFDGTTESNLPSTKAFSTSATTIYALSINRDRMYIADAGNFNEAGKVFVYSMNSNGATLGTSLSSFTVGAIPCGFFYNL